ncbi:UNVERIFIED_CONTAM: hypothetical protein Sindi_2531500, partial [Sesamum indicum]
KQNLAFAQSAMETRKVDIKLAFQPVKVPLKMVQREELGLRVLMWDVCDARQVSK